MQITKIKTDVIINQDIKQIKVHAGFLRLIVEDEQILSDIPLHQVRSILIEGSKLNIPAMLIKLCCERQIPLHILTNLHKHYGSLHFSSDSNVLNRQVQFSVLTDSKNRLYLSKQILHQKLITQQRAMGLLGLEMLSKTIQDQIQKIPSKKEVKSLLGIEGNAAQDYWHGFGLAIESSGNTLRWQGRIKNPCLDGINSMLSLGYSLLATQCQTALTLRGLDPFYGIYHFTNENRPALVYDFMEIFRVLIVDFWVLGLLRSGKFCQTDFVFTKEGVCTLNAVQKNEFFRLWFKRLKKHNFGTNRGELTIFDFIEQNVDLLIEWLTKLDDGSFRQTDRIDRMPEQMLTFKNFMDFTLI